MEMMQVCRLGPSRESQEELDCANGDISEKEKRTKRSTTRDLTLPMNLSSYLGSQDNLLLEVRRVEKVSMSIR